MINNYKNQIITDPETIHSMTGYSLNQINILLYLNRGPKQSNMLTHGLYRVVKSSELYQILNTGLMPMDSQNAYVIDVEACAANPKTIHTPPYIEIEADWNATPCLSGSRNNILGDNGQLILEHACLSIPSVLATNEMLAFYHACLLKPGDLVRFPDPIYPIWDMSIQKGYVNDFLMSEEGGGFYLEYHKDQPHYHHAINGDGFYLLAKWNETKTALIMTGFKIPNGHAVYTMKNAIHCDAGLIGEFLVGYNTSVDCSTVLFRSKDRRLVSLLFDLIE